MQKWFIDKNNHHHHQYCLCSCCLCPKFYNINFSIMLCHSQVWVRPTAFNNIQTDEQIDRDRERERDYSCTVDLPCCLNHKSGKDTFRWIWTTFIVHHTWLPWKWTFYGCRMFRKTPSQLGNCDSALCVVSGYMPPIFNAFLITAYLQVIDILVFPWMQ